jgi:hypothetical protein
MERVDGQNDAYVLWHNDYPHDPDDETEGSYLAHALHEEN